MANCTLFTEPIAACAADAADDAPRFSMTAAPRFCTVSMNAPWSQAVSSMTSGTRVPSMRACAKSGNCVAEWFPQMATLVTWRFCTPAFFASWVFARFSSRRVIANHRSAGTSGAFERAIRQFVLQGFPTTSTRTSLAAWSLIACPWGLKIPPLTESRSPRSMPAFRGIEPTSNAHDAPSKAVLRSAVASMPTSSGWAPSSNSITTPSSAGSAGSISSSRSTTGWSGPSSCPLAMRWTRA